MPRTEARLGAHGRVASEAVGHAALRRAPKDETPRHASATGAFLRGAGDGLLSRVLSDGVPSAL